MPAMSGFGVICCLPFAWEFADGVLDVEALEAERMRRMQELRMRRSEDFDGYQEEYEEEEDSLDTRPYTSEVRCWAVLQRPEGKVDRALLRFQRAPVHAYLEVPHELTLTTGKRVKWTMENAKMVMSWANSRLMDLSRHYVLRVTGVELEVRDLLHDYRGDDAGTMFIKMYFNTQKAARALHGMIHGLPNRDAGEMRVEEKLETIQPVMEWAPFATRLHETDIDPVTYMVGQRKLGMAAPLRVSVRRVVDEPTERRPRTILDPKNGRRAQEFLARWRTAEPATDVTIPFEPRQATIDLEVYMGGASKFPCGKNPGDPIFMISQVTQTGEREETRRARLFLTVSTSDVGERFDESGAPQKMVERYRRTIQGVEYDMFFFTKETEMLRQFYRSMNEYDPDMILGYNILGFDAPYLRDRNELFPQLGNESNIGRLRSTVRSSYVRTRKVENKRGGMSEEHRWIVPGRVTFDLLCFMEKNMKLRSYRLDAVAKEILNESKIDVTPYEMFDAYAREKRALTEIRRRKPGFETAFRELADVRKMFDKIADYCIIDSILVQRLQDKKHITTTLCQFSNIMRVPLSALFPGGQQIRVFSQIVDACINTIEGSSKRGFVIDRRTWETLQVAGATVQEPIRGVSDDVICLDFSSLYPTIIMAYNICPSTYIPRHDWDKYDPKDCHIFTFDQLEAVEEEGAKPKKRDGKVARVTANLDAEDVDTAEVSKERAERGYEDESDEEEEKEDEADGTAEEVAGETDDVKREDGPLIDPVTGKFRIMSINATRVSKNEKADTKLRLVEYEVRFIKQHRRVGVIPGILRRLVAERTAVKNEMKKHKKGSFEYEELDKRQLAIKLVANAGYGFLGAQSKGMLPFPEGFACVTARGRQLIATVNNYLVKEIGATIVYGDTDSTMFTVPGVKGSQCLTKGAEIENLINSKFESPIKMEFEKAMRILIFKKKSYAYYYIADEQETGAPFVKNEKGGGYEMKTMGLKPARRDNCPFQISIFKDSVTQLLDLTAPIVLIENAIVNLSKMFSGELPIESFAINKMMGVYDENNPTMMNVLAKTMEAKGMPLTPGQRVDHVIVRMNDPHDADTGDPRVSFRARSLEWMKTLPEDRRPSIDVHWYTFNALKTMNEPMAMACDFWVRSGSTEDERLRRRRALEETRAVFTEGKTKNSSVVPMYPGVMTFIGNVAIMAHDGGARHPSDALAELLARLRDTFDHCRPFTWNLTTSRFAPMEDIEEERRQRRRVREQETRERAKARNREKREAAQAERDRVKTEAAREDESAAQREGVAEGVGREASAYPQMTLIPFMTRPGKSLKINAERLAEISTERVMGSGEGGGGSSTEYPTPSPAPRRTPATTSKAPRRTPAAKAPRAATSTAPRPVTKICPGRDENRTCGKAPATNRHKYCPDCAR